MIRSQEKTKITPGFCVVGGNNQSNGEKKTKATFVLTHKGEKYILKQQQKTSGHGLKTSVSNQKEQSWKMPVHAVTI